MALLEADTGDSDSFMVGVARVPLVLLHSTSALLRGWGCGRLLNAWMLVIEDKYPENSLRGLRSYNTELLPPWLLQGFESYQEKLVLRHRGISVRGLGPRELWQLQPRRILAATSKCRFREGFASHGMLCNNPPIPLRVLDFLEEPADLMNLALVCKATHQAGHVLLQREFPGGVGPGRVTKDSMVEAIKRRKWSMTKAALRAPIRSSTASASMMAVGTEAQACAGAGMDPKACTGAGTEPQACADARTEAEACAGAGMEPQACGVAGLEPQACAFPEAELAGQVSKGVLLTREMGGRCWDELDWCMLTLLWASKLPKAALSVLWLQHPLCERLVPGFGVEDFWRSACKRLPRDPIILDSKALHRAIAGWAEFKVESPDSNGARSEAEDVMRVVRAAYRLGQGVIIHPGCVLNHFD